MNGNINDVMLLERGFKSYPPLDRFDNDSIVLRFQKRYDDDIGKKYFIDVKKWSNDFIPKDHRDKWWEPFSYECEVQMYKGKERDAINLEFFCGWNLEDVEEFVENTWQANGMEYYERWEDC